MSYTRKIAHNTIVQIAGKGVSTVIGVIVIGMLTRYLGAAGFGQYTTIMAFLQLFGVLVDLGLYVILVKKMSEPGVDEGSIVSNIFTLRLISAVVFLGVAPVVVLFFPYAAAVKWGVLITTLSFLGVTLNQALSGVFQKHLRMDKVVIAEVVGRLILIGATWIAIRQDLGLLWVMAAVVAGSAVNFFLTFWYSRQFVHITLAFNMRVWGEVVRDTWPIALSIAFNLIYFKADTIVLSLYHSEADVGVYGAASKVLEVLVTFPAMFAGLVLPLLTAAWVAADREKFQRVLSKSLDAMLMVALPLIVGTWFVAQPVMDLIAPEFHDSAAILRILIVATSIIFVGNVFGNTVVALNRQKTMMWLYLAVALIALAGYLLFIPSYNYFGAAWVRVGAEFLITVSAVAVVLGVTRAKLSLAVLWKTAVSCLVMAGALWAARAVGWVVSAAIGAAVYLGLMVLLRGLSRETIREVVRIK